MNKKKIIIIAAVVVVLAAVLIAVLKSNGTENKNQSENNTQQQAEATVEPEKEAAEAENKTDENVQKNEEVKKEEKTQAENKPQATQKAEEKVFTPTFMYFVSPSKDANHEATMKMLDELKKEYDGKVNFDIRDIDANPEDTKNFPVEGQTPTLIMLNTKNDICAWNPKCSDKTTLKTAIDGALK